MAKAKQKDKAEKPARCGRRLLATVQRASERAAARMSSELARDAERAALREFQEGGLDFIMGRHTAGAERFAEEVKRRLALAADAAKRIADDGDPLHLRPENALSPAAWRSAERSRAKLSPVQSEPTAVSSPTVPGAVEYLRRSVVTIDAMRKRKQISDRQWRAAQRCRNAYEVVYGQIGGAMDYDRVRGAGPPSKTPHESVMLASETLRQMDAALYAADRTVVLLVACEGLSIEECAGRMFGSTERAPCEDVGRKLRTALDELATLWYGAYAAGDDAPGHSRVNIVAFRAPGSESTAHEHDEMPKARAVHATSSRIYHTGG